MAYKLLFGIALGKVIEYCYGFKLNFFGTFWPYASMILIAIFFRSKHRLFHSLLLVTCGMIHSISIPNFKPISKGTAEVISTGLFSLCSKQAVIAHDHSYSLVKGFNLSPGTTGVLEQGYFIAVMGHPKQQSNLSIWSKKLEDHILSGLSTLPTSIQNCLKTLFFR
ncbi:MAG: hypothetical protein HRU09_05740 [Oligoflexales bacterium]|nr:hypothetical protein [Oligoflexales bacterium]